MERNGMSAKRMRMGMKMVVSPATLQPSLFVFEDFVI